MRFKLALSFGHQVSFSQNDKAGNVHLKLELAMPTATSPAHLQHRLQPASQHASQLALKQASKQLERSP